MTSDVQQPQDPLIGQVVANRYRVLKKMGEGGMGVVYLVEHIAIEKQIAIKILLQEYARKEDLKERFLQEAKAAARIGHENIVDITDFGATPDGSVFFAMEFLDGVDLAGAVKAGPMDWGRAKPILLQICRAMGAAHSKGIIHRDMKPENIFLIEREGRGDFVKVLDFGIAKVSGMSDGERRLTRTGMIFGTPEYMSPEQAQGHKPDHRVDIYALGVIMYEMLTGQVPFKADTFMGILTKHIFETPKAPSEVITGIPAEVEQIVLKAMAKDRDQRFRSMTEMAAAIAQASGRMTRPTGDISAVTRTVTPAPERPSLEAQLAGPLTFTGPGDDVPQGRGKLIAAVAIVAMLVIGGVTYALVGGSEPPEPVGDNKPSTPEPPPSKVAVAPPVDGRAAVAADTVRIKVISTPAGADIYAGEKLLGQTNTSVRLPKGDKRVLLRLSLKGYKDWSIKVLPDEDDRINAALVQDKVRPRRPPRKPVGARQPRPKRPVVLMKDPPTPPKPKVEPKKPTFVKTPELIDPFGR